MTDHPETVTITVPWEAAKAVGALTPPGTTFDPLIEACREATKPKPRFVVTTPLTSFWGIKDTEDDYVLADFHRGWFSEADVQTICDKLNEGER